MGKPSICIGENKGADQLRSNTAKLISTFVFATRIVQFLFYLNQKFQTSSSFLCLYRSVCVGPVRTPHCWFSHEAAQIDGKPHHIHDSKSTFKFFLLAPTGFISPILSENLILNNMELSLGVIFFILEICKRTQNINK